MFTQTVGTYSTVYTCFTGSNNFTISPACWCSTGFIPSTDFRYSTGLTGCKDSTCCRDSTGCRFEVYRDSTGFDILKVVDIV